MGFGLVIRASTVHRTKDSRNPLTYLRAQTYFLVDANFGGCSLVSYYMSSLTNSRVQRQLASSGGKLNPGCKFITFG